jgi:hypothetical protein
MTRIPSKIRKALAFTLEEYELASAERWNADREAAILERCHAAGIPSSPDAEHIETLARGIRDLLAIGHVNAAVCVAINLGEVLAEDAFNSSVDAALLERGKREAEAVKEAALRRWGPPEQRRKIEILTIATEGVAASNGKQAIHEVARIVNERNPGQRITARKVRRVLTGN